MATNRQDAETGVESDAEREWRSRQRAPEGYWQRQSEALGRARKQHENWTSRRRKSDGGRSAWKRVTHTLPRAEAQEKAREFFAKYPKAAYWSEVESWRELPGDIIEFTLRRLPSAD